MNNRYYFSISVITTPAARLKEQIARHHWRRYFYHIKRKETDRAAYHRYLAQSVKRIRLHKMPPRRKRTT